MGLAKSHILSFLLYISVVNVRLPQVTCQDEEGSQCIPKRAFLALLRLPEVGSNLAAYSRTARVIQDAKSRNDMAQLKALAEEGDDDEICIPGGIYLELFREPAMRGHLSTMGRTHKLPEYPGRRFDESEEVDDTSADIFAANSQKRSIATLAKNGDLPISIQDREENEDDEEKRSVAESEHMDSILRSLVNAESKRSSAELFRDYLLPRDDELVELEALDENFPTEKRNVGSLARDFALPPGRRNIASLARDHGLPNGKRNIGALVRDRALPSLSGKRNLASLARSSMVPQNSGKRNIAALARDYSLPYGKRYLGSLARTADFPLHDQEDKRSIASLARNYELPASNRLSKRSLSAPGGLILRTLLRHGRTLSDISNERRKSDPMELQDLTNQQENDRKESASGSFSVKPPKPVFPIQEDATDYQSRNRSNRKIGVTERRSKRQIDFSDEFPLPVMQNANIFDYEEVVEPLTELYSNAEKRFMGRIPQMGPRPTTPPTRRRGR